MVKVQAIREFLYSNYDKIKNLESKGKKEIGKIGYGDIFEVNDEEALYLTGNNKEKVVAVKVLEVIPETVEKPKKRTTKKREEK